MAENLEELACIRDCIESVNQSLFEALSGDRYDSSWIRPMQLTLKQRQDEYKNASLYLDRALRIINILMGGTIDG